MVDKPQEQSSRWSGALQGNAADQWIILRLESLSVLGEFRRIYLDYTDELLLVLEKITFGKVSVIECRGLHRLDAPVDSSSNVRVMKLQFQPMSDARYSSSM